MKSEERWPVLDALRGAALLSMIAYHALYDHYVVFGARPGWLFLSWFCGSVWVPAFSFSSRASALNWVLTVGREV